MTIYVQGDIHGEIGDVRNCLAQIDNPTEDDIIIICGDASLEYGNYFSTKTKKYMSYNFPGTWIIMRGNHDTRYWRDHTEWRQTYSSYIQSPNKGWHFEEDEQYLIQDKYPKIKYVRDEGGIYNIDGYNFLFIPGAYSVDKFYRLSSSYPYEDEEQLTYTEFYNLYNLAEANKDSIDYIISHTCPQSLEPYIRDLFMNFINQSEVDKTTEVWLNNIQDILQNNFYKWLFGHYHDDRIIENKYIMLYKKIYKIGD